MRLDKILLMAIFLMAILTLGAVSASDNNLTNQDLPLAETDDIVVSDYEDDNEDDYEPDEGPDDDEIWEEYAISWEVNGPVYYMDNGAPIASLKLPQDAAGNLEVWKDGQFFANFPLTKGYVKLTLGDLKFHNQTGMHNLILTYAEGDYYVEQYSEDLQIVNYEFKTPKNPVLGQKATYSINFHNNISGILELGDEIIDEFDLTETIYRNFTITNGICVIGLQNLRLGRHYFSFDCEEHDIHLNHELWVYPPVNVKNNVIIGQDSFFTLNLAKNASGEVIFSLYNQEDETEDDFEIYYEDGVFEINSASLTPGKYKITSFVMIDVDWGKFNWEDSPEYDDADAMFSFNAIYPTNALIVANNVKSVYSDGKYFKVKVTINSKAIEDANVVFKINGKVVKRTKTNENGFASFKISKTPGTYKVTVSSLGKTVTKTLTVAHVVKLAKVSVKKSAKKLTLKATLSKVNGKYLTGKQVILKFNGYEYRRFTDSKGVVKLKVPKTLLDRLKVGKKGTYSATYMKDTVKRTVKILK